MNRQRRRAAEARERKTQRRQLARDAKRIAESGYDPAFDPQVYAGVAATVRRIEFPPPAIGGRCMLRSIVALEVLRRCHVDAAIVTGGMLYRVGPDPYRDVVAYCGPGNAGCFYNGQALFHTWLEVGDYIADFSVGDWDERDMAGICEREIEIFGQTMGAIQWTIPKPPSYWRRPIAEVKAPWRPSGTPELGKVWYGPFKGSAVEHSLMLDRVKQFHWDIRDDVVAAIETVHRRWAEKHGIPYD